MTEAPLVASLLAAVAATPADTAGPTVAGPRRLAGLAAVTLRS
jgi:hypothetical protein